MPVLHRCKCIIIGDAAVGKTSIVKSLLGPPNQFPTKYLMTCGVDILTKTLRVPDSNDIIELFIYDCSGKNIYHEMVQKVCSCNVSLIVAVFDVTNEQSFISLQHWLSELTKVNKKSEPIVGIILGNKIDIINNRVTSSDEAHQLAKKHKMRYFDCSAKDMNGIEESFLYLITTWNDMRKNNKKQESL